MTEPMSDERLEECTRVAAWVKKYGGLYGRRNKLHKIRFMVVDLLAEVGRLRDELAQVREWWKNSEQGWNKKALAASKQGKSVCHACNQEIEPSRKPFS